ncbi:MAG: hypothetical protein O3B31_07870 [Chloroflexi bacterium]|nr:hypothetical protein [Chloroflexota bacterium]MDA1003252.1 hypothetical protein [Chloroflexota bacterium]
MSAWFEGCNEIECTLDAVARSLQDLGEHYAGVVSLMPGMTSVELVEQGSDLVIIRTNEGLMERTNIDRRVDDELVTVEFDEKYQAGSKVTTTTH